MWLSEKMNNSSGALSAEAGEVTLSSGENWEAHASGRVRNIGSYAPYGYAFRAPVGEEVLLLPFGESFAALGTKMSAPSLEAGEIKIESRGGASIELKNNGSIVLNGCVIIDREGRVTGWH